MIGSKRSRRLGGLLAGAALVIAIAGCTIGTTTIPAGEDTGLVECKSGSSTGPVWVTGPGTGQLRFQVLSSDATKPLRAVLVGPGGGTSSFGIVWDGTKSTGPKQLQMGAGAFLGVVLWYEDHVPVAQTTTTKWMLEALDANGKDVGFTCSG
jgi:hypothetical protein